MRMEKQYSYSTLNNPGTKMQRSKDPCENKAKENKLELKRSDREAALLNVRSPPPPQLQSDFQHQ